MNCDEAEELLGAYALDALPAEEAASMRAHLDGCRQHAAEAAELRAIALHLHEVVEPIDAPVRLRGRVLDAIAHEAGDNAAPRPISDLPTRSRLQSGQANKQFFAPSAWGAIAAALVIAVGGLLAWNLVLQNRDTSGVERLASRAPTVATFRQPQGTASGTVVYFGADKKALIIVQGLPQLDATKTYEMWAMGDGDPKSIALMQPDAAGDGVTVVSFDASHASTIGITVEPAGGSGQPTSKPVLIANCIAAPAADCAT